MLVRSQQEHRVIGAFLVDLDNFAVVDANLGREAGDELLKTVASRFVGVMPATDTVGRLEGDQFVVLAEGVSLSAGPELLAERLLDALREPFHVWGFEDLPLSISASIGIATNDREPPHDLLRDADIALYQAKARGKDCYVLFKPEMKSSAMDRLELEIDLGTALEDNQFFLLYQPVFDLESVNVCGAEALLRWRHPARGIVGPDSFIPMLEATGMIVPVGLWVLRQACRQAAAWHRLGHQLKVSVNVSMRQLETDEFVDRVQETLTATTLRPELISLELAETSLMRDTESTIRRLQRLKELGVLVAIDDFGTGCSSLAYLRKFPIDALKIDRSFISAMADSPESSNFIRTLVQLGQTLGLETVAEGIEEDWQLKRLQDQRCEFGQGFLFSQPIAPEALEAIMSLETLLS
jgi:diguanylate cyclase (GGDEF)-like protein